MIKGYEKLIDSFKKPHGINGREDFFNSVVLLLLAEIDEEYHLVFQKRSENIRQGGEVCFPGGRVDKLDCTLEDTAVRETCEELGIESSFIDVLGRLDTVVGSMGAVVDVFAGLLKCSLADLSINRDEVERVFSVPVSFFCNKAPEVHKVLLKMYSSDEDAVYLPVESLGLPERYKHSWGNFKSNVYVYRSPEGVIWGLTARIIMDFVRRIDN